MPLERNINGVNTCWPSQDETALQCGLEITNGNPIVKTDFGPSRSAVPP